jgi:ribosomal protein S18 acetylase RimI-like enzyme
MVQLDLDKENEVEAAITVRGTTEEDWEALKKIRLAALLDAPMAFGVSHATAMANTDVQWRDRAAGRGKVRFTLAFMNDHAVGIVGHALSAHSEGNLIAMWIAPALRGTATAARLVEAVKTQAVSQGYARVVLEVDPNNVRAVSFYRKQGFSFLPEWEALESHPHIQIQKMEWRVCRTHR